MLQGAMQCLVDGNGEMWLCPGCCNVQWWPTPRAHMYICPRIICIEKGNGLQKQGQ